MDTNSLKREILFISKATPGDDEFVMWLAPRLEAAGYAAFADILNLEPGDRWRKQVTSTLQDKAVKMLLCCRDSTLSRDGVQEEIAIAEDLSKELKDPRFIVPLRLEKFKKVFGIGGLQYVDFLGSWANGLHDLLNFLDRQDIPRSLDRIVINTNWEAYRKRLAINIEEAPEVLTSNWLRIVRVPDVITYYQPSGSVNHTTMQQVCNQCPSNAEVWLRGFFSFAEAAEIELDFESVGKFTVHSQHYLTKLLEEGSKSPNIRPGEAKNIISSIFRKSWDRFCRDKGFREYKYSKQVGFHAGEEQLSLGKKVAWGSREQRRSSMLRNIARGKVWEYGVSALPRFWPYPHFKIKSRVLFSQLADKKAGAIFDDTDEQFRFRRTTCSGWRNKQWHGRFMAFLELLAGESPCIELPLSSACSLRLDARPVLFTTPVTTIRPDAMSDDDEEDDISTLGNVDIEERE